jgi:hypothetical protein
MAKNDHTHDVHVGHPHLQIPVGFVEVEYWRWGLGSAVDQHIDAPKTLERCRHQAFHIAGLGNFYFIANALQPFSMTRRMNFSARLGEVR